MEEVFLQPHPEAEGEKETSPKFSDNDSNFKCGGIDNPSLDNPSIHNIVDMEEDKVMAENGSELKMKVSYPICCWIAVWVEGIK